MVKILFGDSPVQEAQFRERRQSSNPPGRRKVCELEKEKTFFFLPRDYPFEEVEIRRV